MDNFLDNLDENYVEITPKLRGKTRHRRRAKWLRRFAPRPILCGWGVVFLVQLWCNFGEILNQIVQRFVHQQSYVYVLCVFV